MKDSQDAIERVLSGLRDAEASAEMERRILDTVQNRVPARSQQSWRRLMSAGLAAVPGVFAKPVACGIAITVVLILAIPAIHRRGRTPAPARESSAPMTAVVSAPVTGNAEAAASASRVRSTEKPKLQRAKLVRVHESVALREMHAASRPEPPMPLTEQEKLLVRFVQTRSTEELAAINPMKWAARDAKQRAEFEKFFGP